MQTIPFFVADRPMSLRLLKGLPLQEYPDVQIGIMAHANTTESFQHAFRKYPCEDLDFCDAIGGPCQYKGNIDACPLRSHILKHTVKMCDSGIFTREGATLTYEQLFEAYIRMDVKYGIIIDVFRNPEETLKSAKEALEVYKSFRERILASHPEKEIFALVAVAQGKNVDQYLQNYADLKNLGYTYIAVGGLLHKIEDSARFTKVHSEEVMDDVLKKLRKKYPDDWLFALGCFHPNRLDKFRTLHIWGDYKGWIFQYKKRNETLNAYLDDFIDLLSKQQLNADVTLLQVKQVVQERNEQAYRQKELILLLTNEKRKLKHIFQALREAVKAQEPSLEQQLDECFSSGLLTKKTERFVPEIMKHVGREQAEIDDFCNAIHKCREWKAEIAHQEAALNDINVIIAKKIAALNEYSLEKYQEIKTLYNLIKDTIVETERKHRFTQVRRKIADTILSRLQNST